LLPDPRFNDTQVTRFVNNLMLRGKKNLAYNIFYDAIDIVSGKTNEDGLEVFKKALANVTPLLRYVAAVLVVQRFRSHLRFVLTGKCR
jgi:ribosomal protein S7